MEIVMIHYPTNHIIPVSFMVMGYILMPSFDNEWGQKLIAGEVGFMLTRNMGSLSTAV
jgi:hypothetical protein